MSSPSLARRALACVTALTALAAVAAPSSAQTAPVAATVGRDEHAFAAVAPLTQGWYKGRISLYLSTDASDRTVALQTHTNYVPLLAGAIAGHAVDDIYQITNFKQGNILPSSPRPAGPLNTDTSYSPLWQLSLVTWKSGHPRTLTSEEEVLTEKALGHVAVTKTNVVINCPVIYTPSGGLLEGYRIVY